MRPTADNSIKGYLEEAKRAYKKGGFSRLSSGAAGELRTFVENKTIGNTRLRVPYFVKKQRKIAKKRMEKMCELGYGRKITEADLIDHKSSDTVFILGSGSSINDIGENTWRDIRANDSIGFNRWPVHEHIPTYYTFHLPIEETERNKKFIKRYKKLMNEREREYKKVPTICLSTDTKLVRKEYFPEYFLGDMLIANDMGFGNLLRDGSKELNKKVLDYMRRQGYFRSIGELKGIYSYRGSLSYIISLSILLGYKKIVLCGIDLVDSYYFFETKEYPIQEETGRMRIPKGGRDSDEEHRTNTEKLDSLTMEEIVYSINESIMKPEGIEIYVENTKSALYPDVPLYNA